MIILRLAETGGSFSFALNLKWRMPLGCKEFADFAGRGNGTQLASIGGIRYD